MAFFSGCNYKKEISKTRESNFTSIEFTYRNQLDTFFDFRVDSNRIFFYPKTWDTVYYGIIPDTLFSLIDSSVSYILKSMPFEKREATLKDTSLFGIILIANNDTIQLLQVNKEINKVFLKMIPPLESFVIKKHLILNNAAMLLKSKLLTILKPEPFIL